MGSFFGSFFSLAIYRIPIKQSITHGRSYCPKCNHKLGILDLIPIFSYIGLGGKCRYCKEKIRPRYIILEFFSGIVFLLFAISLKINIYELQIEKLIYGIFGILFISCLFIIGGIEKENHYVSNSVLLFGLIVETIYIIYLYILGVSIYRYYKLKEKGHRALSDTNFNTLLIHTNIYKRRISNYKYNYYIIINSNKTNDN